MARQVEVRVGPAGVRLDLTSRRVDVEVGQRDVTHRGRTTSVHGIADTSLLETVDRLGEPDGYAPLGPDGQVPGAYLPAAQGGVTVGQLDDALDDHDADEDAHPALQARLEALEASSPGGGGLPVATFDLTLEAGWVSESQSHPPMVTRIGDVVYVYAQVTGVAVDGAELIAELPFGFRPARPEVVSVIHSVDEIPTAAWAMVGDELGGDPDLSGLVVFADSADAGALTVVSGSWVTAQTWPV